MYDGRVENSSTVVTMVPVISMVHEITVVPVVTMVPVISMVNWGHYSACDFYGTCDFYGAYGHYGALKSACLEGNIYTKRLPLARISIATSRESPWAAKTSGSSPNCHWLSGYLMFFLFVF